MNINKQQLVERGRLNGNSVENKQNKISCSMGWLIFYFEMFYINFIKYMRRHHKQEQQH